MSNILVAIDDDHFADLLAEFCSEHCWEPGTKFRILTVLPWMPPEKEVRTSRDLQNYVEKTTQSRRLLMEQFAEKLKKRHKELSFEFEVEHEMLQGNAAETILEVAESWPADLLVVGSHGRKGVSLFLMGSVSTAVVGHAPCSVVVIRPKQRPKLVTSPGATNLESAR